MSRQVGRPERNFMQDNETRTIRLGLAAQRLGVYLRPKQLIRPGDYYLAYRNGPAHFLQCKDVRNGMVIPTTPDYPFDIGDCVFVKIP